MSNEPLKRMLSAIGLVVHRQPAGVVMGADLERDLRLVLGTRGGSVALDVGANRGDTIDLIHRVLPDAAIHAFEPNPRTFADLQARHGRTSRITLNQVGVGEQCATSQLHTVENHALNSFLPLTKVGRQKLDVANGGGVIDVPIVTLDDYAAQHGIASVDLLKIDTQGYENRVLAGAKNLLSERRVRCVLVELNFIELYAGQADPLEIMATLRNHDLRLVDFYEKCRHNPLLVWCTALFALTPPR